MSTTGPLRAKKRALSATGPGRRVRCGQRRARLPRVCYWLWRSPCASRQCRGTISYSRLWPLRLWGRGRLRQARPRRCRARGLRRCDRQNPRRTHCTASSRIVALGFKVGALGELNGRADHVPGYALRRLSPASRSAPNGSDLSLQEASGVAARSSPRLDWMRSHESTPTLVPPTVRGALGRARCGGARDGPSARRQNWISYTGLPELLLGALTK